MFGYITVNEPELKIKDYIRYRSYYCGLCKTLKDRFGRIGQLTLSYDMTFLVILLTGLYETEGTTEKHRCLTHPAKKHTMFQNDCTSYAADMNILLTYHNCMDDWFDDKSLTKLSTAKILEKKYRKLAVRYPRQAAAMNTYMELVRKSELEKKYDLDLISGFTGTLLGELFAWKEDIWADTLRRTGFYMGKFIYLMDAYDDMAQDEKKHLYNPWFPYAKQMNFEDTCKDILHMMMADCAKEFEKLPILLDAEILRNIIYSGVWVTYAAIIKKNESRRILKK